MEFDGLKELHKLLNDLPGKIADKTLQSATKKGMDAVLPVFFHAAPKHSGEQSKWSKYYGALASNIRVAKGRVQKKSTSRASVITTGDSFWGYILEKGTRFGVKKEWFLPAFNRSKDIMLSVFKRELGAGILKEAKKLGNK